jgi:hypothetical protein
LLYLCVIMSVLKRLGIDLGREEKGEREIKAASQEFPVVVLTDLQLGYLERVFRETDTHSDMAVQKFEYLQSLRTDDDILKSLSCHAIEISKGSFVTLEEVLDRLQDEDDLYEYITYSQFLDSISRMFPKQVWVPEEVEEVCLDKLYVQIMQDVFDSLPRKGKGLVKTKVFIDNLLEDPQIKLFAKEQVNGETVENVLKRVDRESAELISWEDFIRYFSKNKKPDLKTQAETGVNRSNFYALKSDFLHPEPEDLNPETTPKFQYQYFSKQKKPKTKSELKFTVPAPFDFENREQTKPKSIRQLKFEDYITEMKREEENHLKYRPKAAPVPAEVAIPKYNSMLAAQEGRNTERRALRV